MRVVIGLIILVMISSVAKAEVYKPYRDYFKVDSYYDRLINNNLDGWPKVGEPAYDKHWWGNEQLKDGVTLLRLRFPHQLYSAYKISGNQGWFCELGHQNGFPNCEEFQAWYSVNKKDSTVSVEQAIYLANKHRIHEAIKMIEELTKVGVPLEHAVVAAQYTIRDTGVTF